MNSMILALFGNLVTTLRMIIIVMLIATIFYLCIKIPQLIPVIGGALAITIMVLGGLATVESAKYFTTHNVTLGQVLESTFYNKSTAEEVEGRVLTWNMTNLGFKHETNTVYSTRIEKPYNEVVDLENNDYVLYINNVACVVNETGTDYVKSQYVYSFYDRSDNLILTDILYINFGFYTNQTVIEIYTNNGETAVDMWKAFQVKNGFQFELKAQAKETFNATKYRTTTTVELVENTSSDVFTINCYVDNKIDYLHNREHTSTDVKLLDCMRSESTAWNGYALTTLAMYYKEAIKDYYIYSNNFHISSYKFLDFGDRISNYTKEQLNEIGNVYTLTSTNTNPNVLDILFYNTKIDLSDFVGVNPNGMILNIYINLTSN